MTTSGRTGALAADAGGRLVIAQHDHQEIVVAVYLHEGNERAERVLDGLPVCGLELFRVAHTQRDWSPTGSDVALDTRPMITEKEIDVLTDGLLTRQRSYDLRVC